MNKPYYEQCPKCESTKIVTFETGLKLCETCGHDSDVEAHPAIWARGPGIIEGMDAFSRQRVMNNFFIESRCMFCGEQHGLKQVGYTEQGRGIPAKLCKKCRHPANIGIIRLEYDIRPQDQEYVAKQHEAALAAEAYRQREIEREKAAKAYENRRKRPVVGQTGKTARKKAKKNG